MTQPLRDTKIARELASAKLPSGRGRASYAAIERIFVKQTKQIEVRFSCWNGSRLMPRALNLPEDELLALLRAACRGGVFSEAFLQDLRSLIAEIAGDSPGKEPAELSDLDRLQTHFHALIRARAGGLIPASASDLPRLTIEVGRRTSPSGARFQPSTEASSTGGIGRARVCGS